MAALTRTTLIALAASLALPASAQIQTFSIAIDNVQSQAAGNCLIGSTAQGSGTANLNLGTNAFDWSMTFGNNGPAFNNGLLDNGGELFAHFHNAPPGVNGPVEISLNNGSPKAGNQVLNAAQRTAALDGNFYANIHSPGCGAGEIRGQMIPGLVIPTLSQWGLIVLALLGLTVGAMVLTRRGVAKAGTA